MAFLCWKTVVTPQAFGVCDQEKSLARFGGGVDALPQLLNKKPRGRRGLHPVRHSPWARMSKMRLRKSA